MPVIPAVTAGDDAAGAALLAVALAATFRAAFDFGFGRFALGLDFAVCLEPELPFDEGLDATGSPF
jgi:hypothetical protein